MERRKPGGSNDDLAIVKAAAWAWFQHGSGSEESPILEYDASRIFRDPKPSRFKVEAMTTGQEPMEEGSQLIYSITSPILSPSHTNISLLDGYEIERISRQLDNYMETSRFFLEGESSHRRSVAVSPESDLCGVKKNKKKKKKSKGFWLWPRYGVVCGSVGDVVETRGGGGMRRPEKHAGGGGWGGPGG